jgi:chromosome segregation ATPase
MKRTLLIAGVAVVMATASCTDKEKITQLENSRDSLQTEFNKLQLELTEYFSLVSDIESNINEIKEREQLITLEQEENQPEHKATKRQMIDDLKSINNLMAENKSKIEELNKKLKGSYYQTGKFKKMVAELEERVNTQEGEIKTLNLKVDELLASNENLNLQVDSLNNVNSNSLEIISEKEAEIQQLDEELHTAYYTSGTSAELLEKQIINKEGGFIGIGKVERLNPQLDKTQLNLVDIREVETIPVHSKNLELITEHPSESYEIVVNEEEKQVDEIVILDPNKFWESSKVLVMLTK